MKEGRGLRVSRRAFLASASTAGMATAINPQNLAAQPMSSPAQSEPAAVPGGMPLMLRINTTHHRLRVAPCTTPLACLRETGVLTGTKTGCEHGQGGAGDG